MPSKYLVDIGSARVQVLAKDVKEAAFLALFMHPRTNGTLTVYEREADDADPQSTTFVLTERVCRKCGCTDKRACKGGCAWIEWDLCSQCRPEQSINRGEESRQHHDS